MIFKTLWKVLRERKYGPKILYSAKISFKNKKVFAKMKNAENTVTWFKYCSNSRSLEGKSIKNSGREKPF